MTNMYAEVEVHFPPTPYSDISIGALTLSLNGRECILDAESTHLYWEDDLDEPSQNESGEDLYTSFVTKCLPDKDIFADCPYDLTEEDLSSPDLVATFFVEGFSEVEGASVYAEVCCNDSLNTITLTNVKFED